MHYVDVCFLAFLKKVYWISLCFNLSPGVQTYSLLGMRTSPQHSALLAYVCSDQMRLCCVNLRLKSWYRIPPWSPAPRSTVMSASNYGRRSRGLTVMGSVRKQLSRGR